LEFGALFDQYRIASMTANFYYIQGNVSDIDNANPIGALNKTFPIIYYRPDIDDNGQVDTRTLNESGATKICQMGDGGNTTLTIPVPCYVATIADSIGSVAPSPQYAGMRRSPWLDMANNGVSHGCIKIGCRGTLGVGYNLACSIEVIIQCKHTR